MKILIDTNILISSILFPNSKTYKALTLALLNDTVILCSYVKNEFKRVIAKKFPKLVNITNDFLNSLNVVNVETPNNLKLTKLKIRDINDQPILAAAIYEDVDIILTGDLDFKALKLKHPRVLSPEEYINEKGASF